eukprot:Platyproteum_vivax@DN1657_c0_g1_i1.p1
MRRRTSSFPTSAECLLDLEVASPRSNDLIVAPQESPTPACPKSPPALQQMLQQDTINSDRFEAIVAAKLGKQAPKSTITRAPPTAKVPPPGKPSPKLMGIRPSPAPITPGQSPSRKGGSPSKTTTPKKAPYLKSTTSDKKIPTPKGSPKQRLIPAKAIPFASTLNVSSLHASSILSRASSQVSNASSTKESSSTKLIKPISCTEKANPKEKTLTPSRMTSVLHAPSSKLNKSEQPVPTISETEVKRVRTRLQSATEKEKGLLPTSLTSALGPSSKLNKSEQPVPSRCETEAKRERTTLESSEKVNPCVKEKSLVSASITSSMDTPPGKLSVSSKSEQPIVPLTETEVKREKTRLERFTDAIRLAKLIKNTKNALYSSPPPATISAPKQKFIKAATTIRTIQRFARKDENDEEKEVKNDDDEAKETEEKIEEKTEEKEIEGVKGGPCSAKATSTGCVGVALPPALPTNKSQTKSTNKMLPPSLLPKALNAADVAAAEAQAKEVATNVNKKGPLKKVVGESSQSP